jgi:hypothetical protein
LGGTAVALRHLPPYAPPMSALSADEPAGAHATREPTEQPWSSPFPPSLAFMEEPWRATPLLRLLIPGLTMPANVSAQAQFGFPAYARRTTSALSPTRRSHLRATGSEFPRRGGSRCSVTELDTPPALSRVGGDHMPFDLVGVAGFEPAASSSRSGNVTAQNGTSSLSQIV